MRYIDFRSDTVTEPTEEMREAMYKAEVGDDVYGDDPTVIRLEKLAAKMVGKEAALFVPSGTFGNQLALFTHCRNGQEVILDDACHIVQHEVGASSVIAGVQLRTIESNKGELDIEDIRGKIRGNDIHYPDTGLICLENAHSNGRVIPLEKMNEIFGLAHDNHIPVHLDGARLFNAATNLKVSADKIANYCDSVMFCLSKGLCAPVGSMLAGSSEFIEKARKGRKLMGGGMRQAGIIAAAGIIALEKMTKGLDKDHENALLLGRKLSEMPGVEVDLEDIQINMAYANFNGTGCDIQDLIQKLYINGIKISPPENGRMRFVTHYWISADDIDKVLNCIKDVLRS